MSTAENFVSSFQADLRKFAKKINVAPKVVMQRIAADLHGRTPVDTGRARASWDIKQGSPSDYLPPEETAAGAKDVTSELATITGKQTVYVTTAIPYMKYLEQGSSKQAPAGMVRLSLAEIEVEIEDIIGQLPAAP
jgi:hypothetical protein